MANLPATPSRLPLLRQVGLFAELSDEELEMLGSHFLDQTLPSHTQIYRYGDPSDSFYVIRSGSVAVYRDEVGKPVQLQARFGAGDFFGETGLFDGFQRSASARASEACRLLKIEKDVLLAFLDDHPDILVKLQIAAARRHTLNVAAALDLGVRNEVRIRLGHEVTLEITSGQTLAVHLENLSLGGMCLRGVPKTWEKGQSMRFVLSHGDVDLSVIGHISWRETDSAGVVFATTDDEHDANVQRLLRRLLS